MDNKEKKANYKYPVQMSEGLLDYMRRLAGAEHRTLNAQIIVILEEYRRAHFLPETPVC